VLRNAAAELWGLDLSVEDVAFLRQELGCSNLVVGDAENLSASFPPGTFEVVVAAEILEHLPNPGLCLAGARQMLAEDGALVVTVPNGVAFRRGLKSLLGRETVNPDHNFYFSRRTIARLVEGYGFRISDIRGYRMPLKRFPGAYLADLVASVCSEWACEGIMLTAHKVPGANPKRAAKDGEAER